jgi:hypothetical protein
MANAFPVVTSGFNWTDPTTSVDGTALVPGEVTGYLIGIRADGQGLPGTYAITTLVSGATATSEPLTALSQVLAPGNYWAAIQSEGPVNSVWTNEIPFSVAAPPPVPNPPTSFTVA